MKILIMGPQGCGKGTIAKMLSEHLGIPAVSVGSILRSLPPSDPHYEEVVRCMDAGELVDSQYMKTILTAEFSKDQYKKGYIVDGWARRMPDLQAFNPGFDKVVVLEVSEETSIKRISGRRLCKEDGQVYNIYTLPQEELAKCKGELVQREDDTEEAVKRRLAIYHTQTKEVIDYFDSLGLSVHVNAEPLPEEIFADLIHKLGV